MTEEKTQSNEEQKNATGFKTIDKPEELLPELLREQILNVCKKYENGQLTLLNTRVRKDDNLVFYNCFVTYGNKQWVLYIGTEYKGDFVLVEVDWINEYTEPDERFYEIYNTIGVVEDKLAIVG